MLERFSSQFQSVVLLLVVGMLVVVFSSTFGGPQSQGCSGGTKPAIEVGRESFTDGAFYAVMRLGYAQRQPDELRQVNARQNTANGIVERVLLADEARRLGMRVEPEQALRQIVQRQEVYATLGVDSHQPAAMRFPLRDEDGNVETERLERWVSGLRRTMAEFAEWQAEEILAERMRDVIRSNVTVAPGEAWDAYAREHEKATIRYVRFQASYYGDRLVPTTAELDAFIASHAQQVNDAYAAARTQYQGLEEQVRARHILIKVEASADEATKTAARARATALLARARAADAAGFAALARENSEDEASGRKGGDLGWNARGRMVGPFDEAQFALQPGQVSSALVETEFGFHIIRVEGRRQGDVPEQDAKRDVAEGLYRTEMGRTAAQNAANAMLARLRAGTTLDAIAAELHPEPPAGGTAPQLDPNAPDVLTSEQFGPGDSPIPGLTGGYTVAQAAFALTLDNPVPREPIRAGDDVVLFRLESIEHANRADFTEAERARIIAGLRGTKEAEAVELYVRSLRTRAERNGRVQVNPAILLYGTEDEEEEGDDESESSPDEAG